MKKCKRKKKILTTISKSCFHLAQRRKTHYYKALFSSPCFQLQQQWHNCNHSISNTFFYTINDSNISSQMQSFLGLKFKVKSTNHILHLSHHKLVNTVYYWGSFTWLHKIQWCNRTTHSMKNEIQFFMGRKTYLTLILFRFF